MNLSGYVLPQETLPVSYSEFTKIMLLIISSKSNFSSFDQIYKNNPPMFPSASHLFDILDVNIVLYKFG